MLFQLPDELIELVYRSYFSRYVLSEVRPKCNYKIKLQSGPVILCNQTAIDSAYCWRCHRLHGSR